MINYIISIKKTDDYDNRAWSCFITEFEKLLNAYDLIGFIDRIN